MARKPVGLLADYRYKAFGSSSVVVVVVVIDVAVAVALAATELVVPSR